MRVAFVVNDLHLSGGISVVVRHCALLRSLHGFDAQLVLAREHTPLRWDWEELEHVPVLRFDNAAEQRWDAAVATWWETTRDLFELDARRHAYFVQNLEDRFYTPEFASLAVEARETFDLPVQFITEARWIAETVGRLRPGVPCYYVRNGVDKSVFTPLERVEPSVSGPLRILVEGRAEVWFKGVPEALRATRSMREPHTVTAVLPDGGDRRIDGADRSIGPLRPHEMAAAYAKSDVVLKLSRVEGMYGPPLEGFHRGATCVTTPVTGHEEYVVHGWNGLVVDWDDTVGTAGALDLLARDRRLLHFLRANALETARAWPTWEQSSQFMALALGAILRHEQPTATPGSQRLHAARRSVHPPTPARVALVERPTGLRGAVLARLWRYPLGAQLLRAYGQSRIRGPVSRLVRLLLG